MLLRLHEERPHDGILVYTLARMADREADAVGVERWLGELERIGWRGGVEPSDFARTGTDPGVIARVTALAERELRVARARVERRVGIPGLAPEGTAWDPRRGEVLLSSGIRRTAVALGASGEAREIAPAAAAGVYAVLGMEVEVERDRLWAATAGAPFMRDFRAEDAGRSALVVFDLAKREVAARFAAPAAPSLFNDVALDADGGAWVTDTLQQAVYHLAPGAPELRRVTRAGDLVYPNGISAGPGGALYVADLLGLSRLDPRTGELRRLPAPSGVATLGGIDGLERHGDELVGIQNLGGRGTVWRIRLSEGGGEIVAAEVLEAGHPEFQNPTTGVVVGDDLLMLANPGLQLPTGDRVPDGEGAFVLLRLPLSAEG